MPKSEDYEIFPLAPVKKLEKRIERLEEGHSTNQLNSLVTQIIELIRSNQKMIEDVIHANTQLRSEMSKIVPKLDDLITEMREFMMLLEVASKEEAGPETKKTVEQMQKLTEQNAAILEALNNLNKRIRAGTPVSQLLASGIRMRRDEYG